MDLSGVFLLVARRFDEEGCRIFLRNPKKCVKPVEVFFFSDAAAVVAEVGMAVK